MPTYLELGKTLQQSIQGAKNKKAESERQNYLQIQAEFTKQFLQLLK